MVAGTQPGHYRRAERDAIARATRQSRVRTPSPVLSAERGAGAVAELGLHFAGSEVAGREVALTFLFTDIEGSTRLLQRLAEEYEGVLEEHHRLVRAVLDEHGGREFGTQGDAFFVAFAAADRAVVAAAAIQRSLDGHPWPQDVRLRVRIGVHSGRVRRSREGGYVGLDLHRVARICSAGRGGQVLVSESAAASAAPLLPVELRLEALGAHWLKDLERPEHLFQLVGPGLPCQV